VGAAERMLGRLLWTGDERKLQRRGRCAVFILSQGRLKLARI
jgi:hypothetical protein